MQHCLECLREAELHVQQFPSKADDSGTDRRTAQHLLTRYVNNITSKYEVSSQIAAAALMSHQSFSTSFDTWWCFVWPFTEYSKVRKLFPDDAFISKEAVHSELQGEDQPDPRIDHQAMHHFEAADIPGRNVMEYASINAIDGTASPQHFYYLNRGSGLKTMSFYEYVACVDIIKRETLRTNVNQKGRRPNGTFEFKTGFSQKSTHLQRLRSKFRIPVLAGKPPTKHPGPFKNHHSWWNAAARWTEYVVHAFIPWDTDTMMPKRHEYTEVCKWMEALSQGYDLDNPSCNSTAYARYCCISNITSALSTSKETEAMIFKYQGRARTIWGQHMPDEDTLTGGNNEDCDSTIESLADIIRPQSRLPNTMDGPNASEVAAMIASIFVVEPVRFHSSTTFITSDQERKTLQDDYKDEKEKIEKSMTPQTAGSRVHSRRRPQPDFNEDQAAVFKEFETWNRTDQLLLLVHGGPGTGKTFLTNKIIDLLGQENVVVMATTGIAATNYDRGSTVHSAIMIPIDGKTHRLPKDTHAKIFTRIQCPQLFIIDEISMADCTMLRNINYQLQQIYGNDNLFGGRSVLLLGDFYQLDPVMGMSLPKALMSADRDPSNGSADRTLFKVFRKRELTKQMRAPDDPTHIANLSKLRDHEPIDRDMLDSVNTLTRDDISEDPEWEKAPILVARNKDRHAINEFKARRFARSIGMPVLVWTYTDEINAATSQPVHEYDHEARFFFVPGAPCHMTRNICPLLGHANGTDCTLHSIVPRGSDAATIHNVINATAPGQLVKIRCPEAVIVEAKTLGDIRRIPLGLIHRRTYVLNGEKKEMKTFPITLAFAMTYHKVQGKTLSNVILDLGWGNVDFRQFLVGFSRVKRSANMRKLQHRFQEGNLIGKRAPPHIQAWMESYNSDGCFVPLGTSIEPQAKRQRRNCTAP